MLKDSKFRFIFSFSFLFVIFFFILLFLSSSSKAAGSESVSYFPMEQDSNGVIDPWILTYIESNYDTTNNYFLVYGPTYISDYEQYHFVICPKSDSFGLYGEISSNGYQWSLYQIGSGSFEKREVKIQKPQYWYWDNQDFGFSWQNLNSNLYDSSIDYISNFKILTNNTDNSSVVLKYGADEPNFDMPTLGHAKPYDPLNIPIFGTGLVPPTSVPIPFVPQSHSWGNYIPPSFDSSDPIKSLYDITNYNFGYLKDNISGSINNLGNNIVGMGNQISSTIQYYGGLIVGGINNSISTFYNNMVSLLEPITVPFLTILAMGTDPETGFFSVPYLTRTLLLPDPESLNTMLISHDILGILELASDLTVFTNNVKSQLMVGSGVIYGIHIPSFTFAGVVLGPYFIDFTWYLDYKDVGDSIISAFLVLGFFMWLHFRLPYWLRSEQGDVVGFSKEVGK